MWSNVAMSSAMWIGWARGRSTTARPMRMRWVRAAMALAIVIGEDRTLIAEKWYSASHTELTPKASAASTSAKHSAKASRSVIPSRVGNSMKTPDSMSDGRLADPGEVRLGNLRARGLRGGDVHRGRASARRFHVSQPFFLCRIRIAEQLHHDPVRIQEVDAPGHAVVHDVVDGGPSLHQATVGRLQGPVALHLERKVVQSDRSLLGRPGPGGRFEQGEVVMHHAAGQEGARTVGALPGHLAPHPVAVEPGGPLDVGHVKDDMPDLFGYAHCDSLPSPAVGWVSDHRPSPSLRPGLGYCLIPRSPAVGKAGGPLAALAVTNPATQTGPDPDIQGARSISEQ